MQEIRGVLHKQSVANDRHNKKTRLKLSTFWANIYGEWGDSVRALSPKYFLHLHSAERYQSKKARSCNLNSTIHMEVLQHEVKLPHPWGLWRPVSTDWVFTASAGQNNGRRHA